ncbi:calpain-9-like [Babylonia areolata]|uniref:calpain-9-like n=1 Tax=Babylonia areolata TaxID=304850 RepID=UPI003FD44019
MSRRTNSSRSGRGFKAAGAKCEDIRQRCLQAGALFEDPDFPAEPASIFYSRQAPRPYEWKRPHVSLPVLVQ